jgi:hypothetical protein
MLHKSTLVFEVGGGRVWNWEMHHFLW